MFNMPSFAPCQGSLSALYRGKNLYPLLFALLPHRQGLANRFFFARDATAGDGLANECLLAGTELDIHSLR